MATFSTNQFKAGLKILLDGDPYTIVQNEFVKPGKGQAFNRVKIRNLLSQRMIEKTFKSGESVDAADVIEIEMSFLYQDQDGCHFMNLENYEQIQIDKAIIGDQKNWLKEEATCQILLWNNKPIDITLPNFVYLAVTDSEPGIKGDTVSGGNKMATLETGASLRVPLFVNTGDTLKIDTRTGEYVSRGQ
jgi:elongation factor P